jgi:signal transduction histidine kinase
VEGVWDRLRLEQVLMNLLSNAVKYAPGTEVSVSLRSEGTEAILSVCDRGPGVPTEDLVRIFDRFARAGEGRGQGGLGLGLYVTRQIIEAHGGRVDAQPLPEGGICFEIRLPCAGASTLH